MMPNQCCAMLSPRAGRNFLCDLKVLDFLRKSTQVDDISRRKHPERSAKATRRPVENPWNLFADRSGAV